MTQQEIGAKFRAYDALTDEEKMKAMEEAERQAEARLDRLGNLAARKTRERKAAALARKSVTEILGYDASSDAPEAGGVKG